MTIFETPLSELIDVLNGEPFVTGGYAIRPHKGGYICTAPTGDKKPVLLPHDVTLIGATNALNADNSGGI